MFKVRFVRVRVLGVMALLLRIPTMGLVIREARLRRISCKSILLFRLIQYSFLLKKLDHSLHLLFIIPLADLADFYYSLGQVFGYHFPVHVAISRSMVIGNIADIMQVYADHSVF